MIVEMRKSLDEAHAGLRNACAELQATRAEVAALRNSAWSKIGRALTYVPRKVKRLFS